MIKICNINDNIQYNLLCWLIKSLTNMTDLEIDLHDLHKEKEQVTFVVTTCVVLIHILLIGCISDIRCLYIDTSRASTVNRAWDIPQDRNLSLIYRKLVLNAPYTYQEMIMDLVVWF